MTVEEYWHVRQQPEAPDPAACTHGRQHVALEVTAVDTLTLRPVCSALLSRGPAESVGRITGAGIRPGHFALGATISFENRKNSVETFQRARWVPDEPAPDGLRVFLLSAAPTEDRLPEVSIAPRACGDDQCFNVRSGDAVYTLTFRNEAQNWALIDLSGWD